MRGRVAAYWPHDVSLGAGACVAGGAASDGMDSVRRRSSIYELVRILVVFVAASNGVAA